MGQDTDKPESQDEEAGDVASSIADVALPDNFHLIRPLGRGETASVYLARDNALKRLVAIKVLRADLSADPVCRARFEREAQAAARLSHEGIASVHSVGRLDDGRLYIVMEHVDGKNLSELLQARGPFAIDEARALVVQVCSALAHAHAKNLVHRDLKPANILIDDAGQRAHLTDFGVAAILETGTETVTRLTRENERIGDPRYMSPEQLRGEPLTGQSDIYSLGVIAYELLANRGPFDDAEVTNMAGAHLRRPPPDLRRMRADLPQSLADTLKRCLAKTAAHRPSASELVRLLEDPQSMPAGAVGPIAGFLHELKQRKVYRAAVAYAAAVFVILQAADLTLPALTESAAPYRLTVYACLAGFPVAVVLAWLFDLRHGKLVRTPDDQGVFAQSTTPLQRLFLMLFGVGVSVLLVMLVAWWLLWG
jgi:serine/threonine protein kinase